MDATQLVRSSAEYIYSKSIHVKINDNEIENFVNSHYNSPERIQKLLNSVTWDAENWHYNKDVEERGYKTGLYCFIMDTLNFCFWPSKDGLEYEQLAVGLKNVFENDESAFSCKRLQSITEEELQQWIPTHEIPNLSERVNRLKEVGYVLEKKFNSDFSSLIKAANHSAVELINIILANFPGFRDQSVYKGRLVHFYKRVQIFIGDLWGAYNKPTDPTHPFYFHDISSLTMFPDYRIPQIFLHYNLLSYSDSLLEKIKNYQEIPYGSEEESEIRGASVLLVEKLRQKFSQRGININSVEIDWLLWNWGERMKDDILPHHRTLTIFY